MQTSVHISRELLQALDRRARAMGMSRSRLIVRALERELAPNAAWTHGFFESLSDVMPETAHALDQLAVAIRKARRSKLPAKL